MEEYVTTVRFSPWQEKLLKAEVARRSEDPDHFSRSDCKVSQVVRDAVEAYCRDREERHARGG